MYSEKVTSSFNTNTKSFVYLFIGHFFLYGLIIFWQPTVVDVRSGHGFGDHQSQAALRAASTWMGDRLAVR